ncbi:MAG: hypothetical protein QN122_01250 [Armatimonadota bacterium]|nr:hypothetical protein [Armatimonadota bacterium]MDR7450075.1 hypothetical protein [Armatimonadota bacterium]MDR7458962.1 hypothetical protein [Armatimonadota bacterium]MDR7478892.1 hypothetical protein [Armatimonadota bacterium]MDR7488265.1 hypothetical protein [Armatimonadota bacterium]
MHLGAAIIAGLVGTAAITPLLYMGPMMGMPRMDMVGMLGTMVAPPGAAAVVLGMVMHFVLGAIFAIVYAALWAVGLGAPTWLWGLIFGFVHAVVVRGLMPVVMRMHPRRPEMALNGKATAGVIMGHLVFGLVVALVYRAIAG